MLNKERKELFRKQIGAMVERLRLSKGMSRRELGESLGYGSNSAMQVVARFESGRAGIPKNKIEKLIKILGIKNKDFGLDETKSLRNFLVSGGFLGSVGVPLGSWFSDFIEAQEAAEAKRALSDSQDPLNGEDDGLTKELANLARLVSVYRTATKVKKYSVIDKINILYDLCQGKEKEFIEACLTLKINPDEACRVLENALVERLKKSQL